MVKAILVYPKTDSIYLDTSEADKTRLMPPPVGLCVLAANLRGVPGLEIEIIDGNMFSKEEIINSLDCDFLCLSTWYSNYGNAIEIAQKFKQKRPNAKVIFGGPNATILGELILKHDFVDFVIVGDGEIALKKLILGEPLKNIQNLIFRDSGKMAKNKVEQIDLNAQPFFDLEGLRKTGNENYDAKKFNSFPLSLVRGCIKAVRDGRCSFCAIPILGIRVTKPEIAWKQIGLLNEKYGIRDFAESGDDFLVGNYPEQFLAAKPAELDVEISIYANPLHITPENAKILKKLNVTSAFLGIEHANTEVLRKANKFHTKEDSIKAIKILENEGIEVRPTFLYCLPGESEKTALENFEFAEYLVKNFANVKKIFSSVFIPLKGCTVFEQLLQNQELCKEYKSLFGRDLASDDLINYRELTKLYLKHCCSIPESRVKEIISKTLELVPQSKRRTYGVSL